MAIRALRRRRRVSQVEGTHNRLYAETTRVCTRIPTIDDLRRANDAIRVQLERHHAVPRSR